MRFQNKVVVVTGAAGGIGRATCIRFASEGAQVVATDVDDGRLAETVSVITKSGGKARAFASDISTAEGCRAIIKDVIATEKRIDVLCNNAGLMRRGNIMSISEEDWRLSFAVNIDAMFHTCKAAIPHMIEQGGAAIINTASQWGLHPAPNHIVYNVTKAAVASFTQNLGRDYAPNKIRVNAVCPGEVHTPMLESGVKRSGRTMADLDKLVPYGRVGKPEEIAALIAFIASDEAPYMCGSLIEITGAQAVA